MGFVAYQNWLIVRDFIEMPEKFNCNLPIEFEFSCVSLIHDPVQNAFSCLRLMI